MTQISLTERSNNIRINTIARQLSKPKRVSRQPGFERQLVLVADRKFALSGNAGEHQRLIRRARRQHTAVHDAVIRRDFEALGRHLTDENVDLATLNGLTPLHLAVFAYGQVQKTARWDRLVRTGEKCIEERILNYLLEAGAPVDAVDDMKRLPAACIDGKKLPPMLVHAMEALRKRTERILNDDTTFNAFYCEEDREFGMIRGGPGNQTGRGGNPLGITKPRLHDWASGRDEEE